MVYVKPIPTGKIRNCLKCDKPFPQTDKNRALCTACLEENKNECSDYTIYL